MKYIDTVLNRFTMYRVVLYYLLGLFAVALLLSIFKVIDYNPIYLLAEAAFITAVSWLTNAIFSRVFSAPTNVESVYITALILTLLITPGSPGVMFGMYFWSAVIAMASKYIFAYRKQHVFNPVAIAAVIMSFAAGHITDWWVAGTPMLFPFVFFGGLLIVRKLRRADMLYAFFGAFTFFSILHIVISGGNILTTFVNVILRSPIFFLGFVMLTEPLTAPTRKIPRVFYGALVGSLAVPAAHLFGIYGTPELALVLGNIFAFSITARDRVMLSLKATKELAQHTFELIFSPDVTPKFVPGQYMEWTLPHEGSDTRGSRRYFTIASSPTEKDFLLGIKSFESGSTYKKALLLMKEGDMMTASQVAGDFVLPKDKSEKLVFIAGGIGITPFRSMLKYLVDMNEQRDIVVFYLNKVADEVAYKDVLEEAKYKLGIRVVIVLTDPGAAEGNAWAECGPCDAAMITKYVPDYKDRTYYISGPHGMVNVFEQTLKQMGVIAKRIIVDFFPGFA
ncbi:MAG TPA: oxidoreductase [Candidatus Paceibacterota bacterium]|nr:oxidoreductase [Candidatus Paceibacterota bacterium]